MLHESEPLLEAPQILFVPCHDEDHSKAIDEVVSVKALFELEQYLQKWRSPSEDVKRATESTGDKSVGMTKQRDPDTGCTDDSTGPIKTIVIERDTSISINGPVTGIGTIQDVLSLVVSTGIAAGAYNVLKTWVASRNGRKLKIKVGDIEVEATQMKEADVLRIFELLEEKVDRKKIRELLLSASNKGEGRPEAQ